MAASEYSSLIRTEYEVFVPVHVLYRVGLIGSGGDSASLSYKWHFVVVVKRDDLISCISQNAIQNLIRRETIMSANKRIKPDINI